MALMPDSDRTPTSRLEEVRAARLEKLAKLRELGIDPYPSRFEQRQPIAEAREAGEGGHVRVAGRLVLWRRHGGSTFANLRDASGEIQLNMRRDVLGADEYELTKLLDIGDFVGVDGELFTTKTGELTVAVKTLAVLTKALRPLPEKWHGLTDPELRVRKRHLAYIADPDELAMLERRSEFISAIRRFLEAERFIEVATPVLEHVPGGADAEPFVTHHDALDTDFYLRISLELHHKRLVVGGLERLYEIGRVFRNEGIGREHLQEFDLLEFYWAYAGLDDLKALVQRFYTTVIESTFGTLKLRYGEETLDFTPPWPEVDYRELLRREAGVDLAAASDADLVAAAKRLEIADAEQIVGRGRLIDAIYKRAVRPKLVQPQFLTNHPLEISPLAKRDPDDGRRVQRIQVMMAGSEVGNGFAELNDPLDQRARFEEQQRLREAGDREAQMLDEDYLEALEYGMPPTAGFGVSIERWLMYLTNSPTIREVVAFPLVRPE